MGSSDQRDFVAEGTDAYLRVGPARVVIEPKGSTGGLVTGTGGLASGTGRLLRGTKEIPLAEITAVQLREARGPGVSGRIQISYTGGIDRPGRFSENSVSFTKAQQPAFVEAKERIDRYRRSSSGELGDLAKLAELRDEGVITDEEFEAKKRQILGL